MNSLVLEHVSSTQLAVHDRMAPAWIPRRETAIFLAVWLLLMIGGRSRLFQDPGTFWHTAVGEQILSTGELVHRDSFTFTFADRPWIAHQWLAECGMAAIHRLTGWDGLLLASATLLAAMFSFVGKRLLERGLSAAAVTEILSLLFLGSAHHFHVRPHLMSMLGMTLTFTILCDVEAKRRPVLHLAWLVLIFAVWSNCHGGALGGLATITLTFAGWTGFKLLGGRTPLATWTDAAVVFAVWGICLLTSLANPYGWQMPATWIGIMQLSLPDMIQEHRRLDFHQIEAWIVLLAGCGYVALLGSILPRHWWRSKRGVFESLRSINCTWLVVLVWLLLASQRVRHAPLFLLLAAVALGEMLPYSRWSRRWRQRQWLMLPADDSPRRWLQGCLPVMFIVLALTAQVTGLAVPFGDDWVQFDRTVWPVELIDDLRAIELDKQADKRIFNALHFGGFITFHAPGLKTFIDDRCELFGDEALRSYYEAETEHPQRIDRWQSLYSFQHALVRSGSPFDQHLSHHSAWRLVRRCPAGALYRLATKD